MAAQGGKFSDKLCKTRARGAAQTRLAADAERQVSATRNHPDLSARDAVVNMLNLRQIKH
jgi:hypothetical protein